MHFHVPSLHSFRLPIRLVEAQFGQENFDDCGDAVAAKLVDLLNAATGSHGEAGPSPTPVCPPKSSCNLPLDWDFDDTHPNPWFHTLNFSLQLPSPDWVPHIVAMLHRMGLLDPPLQVLNRRAKRAARAQKKATRKGG